MDEKGGYAPRSPDLSAYHGGPAPPSLQSPSQQQYQPPSYSTYQPPQPATQYNPAPPTSAYQAHYIPPPAGFPVPGMQQPGGIPYLPGPPGVPNAEMQDAPEIPAGPATATGNRRGRKPKKPKLEEPHDEGLPPAPGVAEGIEVKTKFPVARIKRIMQADEDVGKVAQVTPTAVSKALELFMISLVTKSAAHARAKSAKKVTAQHLKQVIQQDESFDFLSEIVSKVPDAPTSKKEAKAEDSDEGEGKKKRGRGKRKTEDEDW